MRPWILHRRKKLLNKEMVKRYSLLIVSLFLSAFGVALTKHMELGVSPISSVANILSYQFPTLTLGTWLIIWNCILIIGQFLILRKDFRIIQLLQIPVSFLFGYFTDICMWCVSYLSIDTYGLRLLCVVIGVIILGLGVSLSVLANVIMNSGEAFVKAISDVTKKNFGNVKVAFDILCVLLSIVLSLVFFESQIIGTREGTLITAVCTGIFVKLFTKQLHHPIGNLLK